MNILGVGTLELALVLVIALVVAGPKRMAQWAYIAGRYMAQFRVAWGQMMENIQKELDDAGVDIKVPKDIPTRSELNRVAGDALRPLTQPMQQAMKDYEAEMKQINKMVTETAREVQETSAPDPTQLKAARTQQTGQEESPQEDPPPPTDFGTWSSMGASQEQE